MECIRSNHFLKLNSTQHLQQHNIQASTQEGLFPLPLVQNREEKILPGTKKERMTLKPGKSKGPRRQEES